MPNRYRVTGTVIGSFAQSIVTSHISDLHCIWFPAKKGRIASIDIKVWMMTRHPMHCQKRDLLRCENLAISHNQPTNQQCNNSQLQPALSRCPSHAWQSETSHQLCTRLCEFGCFGRGTSYRVSVTLVTVTHYRYNDTFWFLICSTLY